MGGDNLEWWHPGASELSAGSKPQWREAGLAALACGGVLAVAYGVGSGLRVAIGLPVAIAAHGALMIAAWGAMAPVGAIIARYFKVTPHQNFPAELDNMFWWRWHRVLQYGAVAISTVGLAAILSETGGRFSTLHGKLGLLVMTIGWLQIASAAMRGTKGGPTDKRADPHDPATWHGDHFDMTRRRRLFEGWHKRAGWAVVVLAGITVLLGIDLVGAPVWLVLLAALLQGGSILLVVDSVHRRRWTDTYAALWGPDAADLILTGSVDRKSSTRDHDATGDGGHLRCP